MSDTGNLQLIDVYLSIRDRLKRLILARGVDTETAEDILQEVFLKLRFIKQEVKFDHPAAYIFKITNNLATDHFVKSNSRKVREKKWFNTQHDKITVNYIDTYLAKTPDITQAIESKQKLEKLLHVLTELPPKCRAVFLACRLKGLSHKQAATEFNISISTVEKHIAKASHYIAKKMLKYE